MTSGFPGTYHDATVNLYDTFMQDMTNDLLCPTARWEHRNKGGSMVQMQGQLYALCDGGYDRTWNYVTSSSQGSHETVRAWSKMHESLRKCVEDLFGILKVSAITDCRGCCLYITNAFGCLQQRFRILKNGIDFPSFTVLDDMMFTLAAIHNMMLSISDDEVEGRTVLERDATGVRCGVMGLDSSIVFKTLPQFTKKLIYHFGQN